MVDVSHDSVGAIKNPNSVGFMRLFWFSVISGLVVFAVCAVSYFFIDVPVAKWVFDHLVGSTVYGFSHRLGALFSPHHWLVVMIILGVIAFVACFKERYQPILRVCAPIALALFLAFCVGACLKFGIGRGRPNLYFLMNIYSFQPGSTLHVWHSSPSGHALMTFAGLMALSLQWRPLRLAMVFLAVCVAMSRIFTLSHFVGDVILGAWVGTLSAMWARAICAYMCVWMKRLMKQRSSTSPAS